MFGKYSKFSPRTYCLGCAHELIDLTSPRCPTCGRPFDIRIPASIKKAIPNTLTQTLTRKPLRFLTWATTITLSLAIAFILYLITGEFLLLSIAEQLYPLITPKMIVIAAFCLFLPACLFMASIVTGWFAPAIKMIKISTRLKYSPGVYLLAICLYFWLAYRPWSFITMMTIPSVLWVYSSFLGTTLGYTLRLKYLSARVLRLQQNSKKIPAPIITDHPSQNNTSAYIAYLRKAA